MLVKVLTEDGNFIINKNIYFNSNDKFKYKCEFEKKKEMGIFKSDNNFEDENWIVIANNFEYRINFKTNEIALKNALNKANIDISIEDFLIGVKSYVMNTASFVAPTSINTQVRKLFEIIEEYGFFESKHIESFTKKITPDNAPVYLATFGIFDYIGIVPTEEYYNVIHSQEERTSNTRTLPSFESIFRFGDIMADFMANANDEEFIQHGVVILWWLICNRIPLRPTEFVLTTKDCVSESDGKYYIKLQRNTGKGGRSKNTISASGPQNYYEEDIVRIDKNLFDIINRYNKLIDEKYPDRSNYLFDKTVYRDFLRYKGISKLSLNQNIFTSSNLVVCIDNFYSEVINNKYRISLCSRIEKENDNKLKKKDRKLSNHMEILRPYDLRHIAIINLIMLGAEPLTVMRLAGHSSLNTTEGYYDHTKEYGYNYVLTYSKYLKKIKMNEISKLSDNGVVNANDLVKDALLDSGVSTWKSISSSSNKKQQYKKVNGGFCRYNKSDILKYCFAVNGIHSKCIHFISDDSELLKKELRSHSKRIDSIINTIKSLVENHKIIVDFSRKYSIAIESFRDELTSTAVAITNLDAVTAESVLNETE